MRSREGLLERLTEGFAGDTPGLDTSEIQKGYAYTVNYICDGEYATRSLFFLDASEGHFRLHACKTRDRGDLRLKAEYTLIDPQFGTFDGWVFNTHRAKNDRSFFFSKDEAFPDSLPGMFLVCEGPPWVGDQPPEYDVFAGFGATRRSF